MAMLVYQRVSWKHFSIFFGGAVAETATIPAMVALCSAVGSKWRGPEIFHTHGWLENP